MHESRKFLLRATAIAGTMSVLALTFACQGVKAPVSPNPGKPLPGMQDMYVVSVNGTLDLVGFAPTASGTVESGAIHVHRSIPMIQNRASLGALASTDSVTVTFVVTGPPTGLDLATPTYEAFDTAGDAWMSVRGTALDGSVVEYTPANQKVGDSVPPAVVIGGLQYPAGMTFDRTGNLWVLDAQTDRLVEFSSSQLAQSGSPTPAVTVSLAALNVVGSTYAPFVLAIDPTGNFWVSANIQSRAASAPGDSLADFVVAEFASSDVQAGGTPTPLLTIATTGVFTGGYGPGIAFDSVGNLWTGNADSGTVTQFPAASLTAGSHPQPTVRITGTDLVGISDVAIDPVGILFVATGYGFVPGAGIFGYLPSQLTASGTPTPAITFIPADGLTHIATRP